MAMHSFLYSQKINSMEEHNIFSFIQLLHSTHKAEWEATPSTHDAICWLNELIEFLFPNNHLNKQSTYEGRLKKNQIGLENMLLSYLDPNKFDIEQAVRSFYDNLQQ